MLDFRKNKYKLIAAGLALVLIAIGVFAAVRAVRAKRDAAYLESYGQTALYAGSYTVTYDLYRYFYLNYKAELKADYKNDAGEIETDALDRADPADLDEFLIITYTRAAASELRGKIAARIAEAVRGLYATISLAADYGITPEDGDIKAAAAEYIDSVRDYYGASDYAAELENNCMTEKVFDFLVRVDGTEDKLFAAMTAEGGAIESGDEALLAIFRGDAFVRVKQIFIENDAGESVEDNRALADEVLAEYRGGVDFTPLIGRYSEDFSMPADGYYFTHGEMTAAFEAAAFALGEGEVSEVVESDDGFHILLRLPKDESYITAHFDELKSQYQNARFYAMIDERAARLTVTEADYVRALDAKEIH